MLVGSMGVQRLMGGVDRVRSVRVSVVAVLAVAAVIVTAYPLAKALLPIQIDYNEGWNAYRQHATALGLPIYELKPAYYVTNYPPLSFFLIGNLSKWLGDDPNLLGRMVSILSLAAVCVLVGCIAFRAARSRLSGLYAGLCLWCWIAIFAPWRVGVNDPQLLATSFMLAGFYLYFASPARLASIGVSAALFALALLTKHNLIALPLAVVIHMLLERRWRGVTVFASVGLGVGASALAIFPALDGGNLLVGLLWPRAFTLADGFRNISGYGMMFYGPVAVGAIALAYDRVSHGRKLLAVSLIVTHLVALAFVFGDGVGQNIFFDALIMTAIACGIAIERAKATLLRPLNVQGAYLCVALVPALPIVTAIPGMATDSIVGARQLPSVEQTYEATVAFLAATSGPVICEHMKLCYDAGKAMVFDPYFVRDQEEVGAIREADISRLLDHQVYAAIEMEADSGEETISDEPRSRFSKAFMVALLRNYVLQDLRDGIALFVPRARVVAVDALCCGLPEGLPGR